MTFEHLSDGEFEEFTYDILVSLGFTNLNWRRGSGTGGATADQGRDIVADRVERDFDGHQRIDRWFAQCKHFQRGVPAEKVQGAVAWAMAERPAVLLFVVSNFLSNSAKTWLDNYIRENRPPFRIRMWERKDLEQLVSSQPKVAQNYRLDVAVPLDEFHSAHLHYTMNPCSNSLDYFLGILDELEPAERDEVFGFSYHQIINPRRASSEFGKATEPVDYPSFRAKCGVIVEQLGVMDAFVVRSIMADALHWARHLGDAGGLEETTRRHENMVAVYTAKLEAANDDTERRRFSEALKLFDERLATVPERQRLWAGRYQFLCETVLPKLQLEEQQRMRTIARLLAEREP